VVSTRFSLWHVFFMFFHCLFGVSSVSTLLHTFRCACAQMGFGIAALDDLSVRRMLQVQSSMKLNPKSKIRMVFKSLHDLYMLFPASVRFQVWSDSEALYTLRMRTELSQNFLISYPYRSTDRLITSRAWFDSLFGGDGGEVCFMTAMCFVHS